MHSDRPACYPAKMEGANGLDSPAIQTPAEEKWNSITHGIGAILSAGALALLVTMAGVYGGALHVVTVLLFGIPLLLMYLVSTCYHACRHPVRKSRLQILDHLMIYALIAGTYSPFLLVLLRGGWGWSLFGTLWGMALAGMAFKLRFGARYELVSTLAYVAMGWVGLIAAGPLLAVLPTGALALILAGGIAYTAGAGFFLWERLPFNHVIWHGFVMAGSALHALAVLGYVAIGT